MTTTAERITVGDWEWLPYMDGGAGCWLHTRGECAALAEGGRCCYCGAPEPELIARQAADRLGQLFDGRA